jgi:hypothetical protein
VAVFQGGRPQLARGNSLTIIDCKGARKAVILRRSAKTGSHRIEPNIPSDSIEIVSRPQDMIIKESLPKALLRVLGVNKTRFLLQDFYELHEIAGRLETLQQQVNVIGHYAVGMNGKRELRGFGAKQTDKPVGKVF